jgi:hypothetical protein
MPLKVEEPKKSVPVRRIISSIVLIVLIGGFTLAVKKPAPVAVPQSPTARTQQAQSFEAKVSQLEQAQAEGRAGAEIRLTADEIQAAFAQTAAANGSQPAAMPVSAGESMPAIEAPQVSFAGDTVTGQFVTVMSGKKVYVTVNGRLGAKDGYATFEPTGFKVGDLIIPVSLVNNALQKKLTEEREKLKLPEFISDLRVENGELVVKQK